MDQLQIPWSSKEATLAPMQSAVFKVSPQSLQDWCGTLTVNFPGLTGKPDWDIGWIVATMTSMVPGPRGEFGFMPHASDHQFAVPEAPALLRDQVMEQARKCYEGLVNLIRRCHPGFWLVPGSTVYDFAPYVEDPHKLSADALMFLTGCLQWVKLLVDGRFSRAAFQAYVQPSAGTPPSPQKGLPNSS